MSDLAYGYCQVHQLGNCIYCKCGLKNKISRVRNTVRRNQQDILSVIGVKRMQLLLISANRKR